MPLIDGNVTRCDIRVPNDLYEQIESLAIERGAKIHHRSNKPEVTGTILELIKIGLTYQHLSPKSSDSLSGLSGNLSDEALEDIASKVYDRLLDLRSDNLAPVSDLTDKISDIEDEMKKRPTQKDLEKVLEPILKDIEEIDRALKDFQRKRENNSSSLSQTTDSEDRQLETVNNDLSPKGITKATLDPIFNDVYIPNDALTQAELAKRFGMDSSSVLRSLDQGDEHFMDWSHKKDPDGHSWQYIGEFMNPKTNRKSKYFISLNMNSDDHFKDNI